LAIFANLLVKQIASRGVFTIYWMLGPDNNQKHPMLKDSNSACPIPTR
jgi:hypothetical protein